MGPIIHPFALCSSDKKSKLLLWSQHIGVGGIGKSFIFTNHAKNTTKFNYNLRNLICKKVQTPHSDDNLGQREVL